MTTIEILLLGFALSMDAFAVTISNTFAYRCSSKLRRFLMPVFFGLFQALMTLIGYFAGSLISDFIDRYAGLIAFAILCFIGGKMIWDALHDGEEELHEHQAQITVPILFFQAIATSIDALAVGVSFAALSIDICFAAIVIGLTTFVCCIVALLIGKRFGLKLGNKATIVGGVVLIVIGIKALLG